MSPWHCIDVQINIEQPTRIIAALQREPFQINLEQFQFLFGTQVFLK